MNRPIITLTSDFGASSPYVAAMKGVILSINPDVTLIDITHSIGPQNIRQGALVLADTLRFPPETIHVAVIDPGVGSDRAIIFARFNQQNYIAPDNGLLSRLAHLGQPSKIIAVTDAQFWLPEVSATFHGRDIMAPVAARLSLGLDPEKLGSRQEDLKRIKWAEVRVEEGKITGAVSSIDSFGNLVTDILAEKLNEVPTSKHVSISCDGHETQGIFYTYSDQPPMTFIALVGSSGYLELAIVGSSAMEVLGVGVGAQVVIRW